MAGPRNKPFRSIETPLTAIAVHEKLPESAYSGTSRRTNSIEAKAQLRGELYTHPTVLMHERHQLLDASRPHRLVPLSCRPRRVPSTTVCVVGKWALVTLIVG